MKKVKMVLGQTVAGYPKKNVRPFGKMEQKLVVPVRLLFVTQNQFVYGSKPTVG